MKSNKPYKICSFNMCNRLTKEKYCDKHQKIGEQEEKDKESDRQKEYTKYQRNKEHEAFYNSTAWRRVREYVLNRDNGICQLSLLDKRIVKADMIHHIYPLEDYRELALSPVNLISLSHKEHSSLHNRDGTLSHRGIELTKKIKDDVKHLINDSEENK